MFIFKKKTEPIERINLDDVKVHLDLDGNNEYTKQLNLINFEKNDLKYLKYLQDYVKEYIPDIVNSFYGAIQKNSSLVDIIEKNSSIERLKKTLSRHIFEMLNGEIDQSYFNKRMRIAKAHVKIGLSSGWYLGAYQIISQHLFDIAHKKIKHPEDLLAISHAINKITNFEQQIVIEAYESERESILQEAITSKLKVIDTIMDTSQKLAIVTEETSVAVEQLIAQSESISELAKKGKEDTDSAEEVVNEGQSQIDEQSENMIKIVNSVQFISDDVNQLLKITDKMEEIVEIIKKVADSTHMLSLNAQIEAARAGESGRGFSVVAMEVGKLSNQTQNSVKDVTNLIKNIKEQSVKVSKALNVIHEEVNKGGENMEKTINRFGQVTQLLKQTREHTTQIEGEISEFVDVIQGLGGAFENVAYSAESLNDIVQELQ